MGAVAAGVAAEASGQPRGGEAPSGGAALPDLQLEYVFDISVTLDPPVTVGRTGVGVRRIIPITGGTVRGPALNGVVMPGGADWQVIRDDGVTDIDARYTIRADDGALIYISNPGIREATPEVIARLTAGEIVPPSQYYFRTTPRCETSSEKYRWMTRRLFVCRGVRNPNSVDIRYYRIT